MPRGARILVENACYHIFNRGNQKRSIFLDAADYQRYLFLLKLYKSKYKVKLYGWCLMPNHFHLIVEPKHSETLEKFMQSLTQTYTFSFNRKYKTTGRLWQGRFKHRVMEKEKYLIDCIFYVEANPVRAGLVDTPSKYPWSSYQTRIFGHGKRLLDLPDCT